VDTNVDTITNPAVLVNVNTDLPTVKPTEPVVDTTPVVEPVVPPVVEEPVVEEPVVPPVVKEPVVKPKPKPVVKPVVKPKPKPDTVKKLLDQIQPQQGMEQVTINSPVPKKSDVLYDWSTIFASPKEAEYYETALPYSKGGAVDDVTDQLIKILRG
jgi:outer membrane biosynthesis protein TonB